MVDRLDLGILEQCPHRVEITRHEHLRILNHLLVYDPLIGKLDGGCKVHEIAKKGETTISKVTPNSDESYGEMNGAHDHPLVCG